jgi:8-oxo-dGTP pyrophosphatase MutT (NUDIX family)
MKKSDIISAVKQHGCTQAESTLFSVALPLIKRDGEYHLLYEVRAETLRRQPNEICFPGGKVEHCETTEDGAIRETTEELNISKDVIEMVDPLIPIMIPHNVMVFPYVVFLNTTFEELKANEDEVQELFTVPLSHLMAATPEKHIIESQVVVPENFPFDKIQNGKDYKWNRSSYDVYFFEYDHKVIWGLTAKITAVFIRILKGEMDVE